MSTDDKTDTVDVIPTVAQPRSHFSREIYNGAELHSRPARPGAADALALPSLFNGRRITRAEIREQITKPVASYTPPMAMPRASSRATFVSLSGHVDAIEESDGTRRFYPMPATTGAATASKRQRPTKLRNVPIDPRLAGTYQCRPDSTVGRTIAHMQANEGFLPYTQIDAMFGTNPTTRSGMYQQAVRAGVLKRVQVNGERGYALPSYYTPPPAVEIPGAVRDAIYRLNVHTEQLRKLTAKADEVRTRMAELQRVVDAHERTQK